MKGQVQAFLASLESQEGYSASTRLAYDNDLRCFIRYLEETWGREPALADFSPEQIANFLNAERVAGRRPSTLLRRRASVRRFASFLRQQQPGWAEWFDVNAHLIEEAISGTPPLQQPQYLTVEQVSCLQAVLESAYGPRARRDQAILALLLETGLTVGMLIALNLADLDSRTGSLHLCPEQGREITVPLREAAGALQRYLKEGRPELNYHPHEAALFISQAGGRMSRQGVWQVLRQWGRRAGIPVTLSPRLARHTAAYSLARSGRPLLEIQTLLGHSNPLSTQALLRRMGSETGFLLDEEASVAPVEAAGREE
jgi:integrase/recombinase XerD